MFDSHIPVVHIPVMNPLKKYLRESGIRQEDFATEVGLTQATVSRLCNDAFTPLLQTAFRIERVTGGAVPASYWDTENAA